MNTRSLVDAVLVEGAAIVVAVHNDNGGWDWIWGPFLMGPLNDERDAGNIEMLEGFDSRRGKAVVLARKAGTGHTQPWYPWSARGLIKSRPLGAAEGNQ